MTASTAVRCTRCKKPTARSAAVDTKAGAMCKKCADRLPPHLHLRRRGGRT
jgi:formylmethanofuran dehydrogenase subunit E